MLWILEHYCSEVPFLDGFLLVKEGCPNKVKRVWLGRDHRDLGSDPFSLWESHRASLSLSFQSVKWGEKSRLLWTEVRG